MRETTKAADDSSQCYDNRQPQHQSATKQNEDNKPEKEFLTRHQDDGDGHGRQQDSPHEGDGHGRQQDSPHEGDGRRRQQEFPHEGDGRRRQQEFPHEGDGRSTNRDEDSGNSARLNQRDVASSSSSSSVEKSAAFMGTSWLSSPRSSASFSSNISEPNTDALKRTTPVPAKNSTTRRQELPPQESRMGSNQETLGRRQVENEEGGVVGGLRLRFSSWTSSTNRVPSSPRTGGGLGMDESSDSSARSTSRRQSTGGRFDFLSSISTPQSAQVRCSRLQNDKAAAIRRLESQQNEVYEQYQKWKNAKWGEDILEEVEFDDDDIDLEFRLPTFFSGPFSFNPQAAAAVSQASAMKNAIVNFFCTTLYCRMVANVLLVADYFVSAKFYMEHPRVILPTMWNIVSLWLKPLRAWCLDDDNHQTAAVPVDVVSHQTNKDPPQQNSITASIIGAIYRGFMFIMPECVRNFFNGRPSFFEHWAVISLLRYFVPVIGTYLAAVALWRDEFIDQSPISPRQDKGGQEKEQRDNEDDDDEPVTQCTDHHCSLDGTNHHC